MTSNRVPMADRPLQASPLVSGPWRSAAVLTPLLLAAAMMAFGLWLRWPTLSYEGPPDQNSFKAFATTRMIYSDIGSLFFRDGLSERPRPYFDYPLEYPVGIGFAIYMLNAAQTLRGYFLATSLFLLACGLVTTYLVSEFPHGRPLLLALSPALALYVNLNWDLWGIVLMVAALLLFVRAHDGPAAIMLAAAVWTKFFPVVFLPLMLLQRVRDGRWKQAGLMLLLFVAASALINGPVLIARPDAWAYFFAFSRLRGPGMNLWLFAQRAGLSTPEITVAAAVLFLGGLGIIGWKQWRSRQDTFLPLCCAAIGWFIFINKAYSPQYDLWLVTMLAVAGASTALATAWSAADLLTCVVTFLAAGTLQFPGAYEWATAYGLEPVTVLREVILLVVIVRCVLSAGRATESRAA